MYKEKKNLRPSCGEISNKFSSFPGGKSLRFFKLTLSKIEKDQNKHQTNKRQK